MNAIIEALGEGIPIAAIIVIAGIIGAACERRRRGPAGVDE